MRWENAMVVFIYLVITLNGCGIISKHKDPTDAEAEKRQLEKLQYQPVKEKNSLEGYEEFIARNPDSHMIHEARRQLDAIRFAPYEKINTIEGFLEFISKYPDSSKVTDAKRNIEKLAFQAAEKTASIEGYSTFLAQYPQSHLECEARDRLAELTFRKLNDTFQADFGFDLLLFRLEIRRLQKELSFAVTNEAGNFKLAADLVHGKTGIYFITRFIILDTHFYQKFSSHPTLGGFFSGIVSPALNHVSAHFKRKNKIEGIGIEIINSPFGFCKAPLESGLYYFPVEVIDLYAKGTISRDELFSKALRQLDTL